MKKEVLIAIIIGFGLGLIITFGIWTANKTLKESAPEDTAPAPQEKVVSPVSVEDLSLTLTSPKQNSISEEETLMVEGTTLPQAMIVVLFNEGEEILEANSQGAFSVEIELASGVNEITVVVYDELGNETEETLTVVYSTAEI